MRKRFLFLFFLLSLFMLASCSNSLTKTQWKVTGYVDGQGNEQTQANANGAFSTLSIAFTDDKSGMLSMNGASYPFTYKQDKNITVTLQSGEVVQMSRKGNKLLVTYAGVTLVFQKQ